MLHYHLLMNLIYRLPNESIFRIFLSIFHKLTHAANNIDLLSTITVNQTLPLVKRTCFLLWTLLLRFELGTK